MTVLVCSIVLENDTTCVDEGNNDLVIDLECCAVSVRLDTLDSSELDMDPENCWVRELWWNVLDTRCKVGDTRCPDADTVTDRIL